MIHSSVTFPLVHLRDCGISQSRKRTDLLIGTATALLPDADFSILYISLLMARYLVFSPDQSVK